MTTLAAWENFYIIVGSASGALIGLQFVVIALIADRPIPRMAEASDAFATPTIVHFGAVLLVSAIVSIPWDGIDSAAIAWGGAGLCGVIYTILVAYRMRTQQVYRPVFEDWLFHAVFTGAAYLLLFASAFFAGSYSWSALFAVSIATLGLLFVGIRNAWDAVTYHVYTYAKKHDAKGKKS